MAVEVVVGGILIAMRVHRSSSISSSSSIGSSTCRIVEVGIKLR